MMVSGTVSTYSYVVNLFSHFRHSRLRRTACPSLLERESTTLSSSKPQKGHFIAFLPFYSQGSHSERE
jgi:hypothetical protein